MATQAKAKKIRRPLAERANEARAEAARMTALERISSDPNMKAIVRAESTLSNVRATGKKDVDSAVATAKAALRGVVEALLKG